MRQPKNYIEAKDRIANRIPFAVSSMTGESWNLYGAGWLNNEWRERWFADKPEYTVYSYRTPIAWYSADNGWRIVDQRFSPTTGRHQSHVRQALAGV